MTEMLKKAFAEAQALPADFQDTLAAILLAEIADDKLWDEKFAKHPEVLDKLVEKACEDIREGRVYDMGWDEL